MHLIEQTFGKGCNLYDVLSCRRDADKAKLRKAYYRAALKYHPDRNPDDPEAAHEKFQAISLAYQILQDADSRAEYDETGVIPQDAPDDDDKESKGVDQWKEYFDAIFGKLTTSQIEDFASKYKCSDEEKKDVLKEFRARKGNLVKMLDFVMLSEARDAIRWVEDFIEPAMKFGELDDTYRETMKKTLQQCQKKVENETAASIAKKEDDDDDEATESEEENESPPKVAKKRPAPKKGKPTQAKHKKKENSMNDLVAAIQNKNRGGSILSNLGRRYGGAVDDDIQDPMDDAEFAKARSKMNKRKTSKK